jgi:arabinose-5-phosphate isomerase
MARFSVQPARRPVAAPMSSVLPGSAPLSSAPQSSVLPDSAPQSSAPPSSADSRRRQVFPPSADSSAATTTTTTTTHAIDAIDAESAAVLAQARAVIAAEATAMAQVATRLNEDFVRAVHLMHRCQGRIVVTGMGKSGLIGQKISATFASTGAPSLFMHAAEAIHGDLGRITADDVVLALSNSGQSEEIVRLIRPVKALGAALVALTGAADSYLGRHSDAVLCFGAVDEACPMGLVPTASTAAMLVMGDALAMCLFRLRGASREAYARRHPGGPLGRKLQRVQEVMRQGAANPLVPASAPLRQVIATMSRTVGRPGAASLVDAAGLLVGFFTDGDLRRLLQRTDFSVDVPAHTVMQTTYKSVLPASLVADAARLLQAHQIDQLPVVDLAGIPVGLLDVQDVLGGGLAP